MPETVQNFDFANFKQVDSINHIDEADRGRVVLASSHAGLYCGYRAVRFALRGVILNDAGVGYREAGIAALPFCEAAGMPAASVSYLSARIGDCADMRARGVISHANAQARALGVVPGMACEAAVACLLQGPLVVPTPPEAQRETRSVLTVNGQAVVCIDSASLIQPEDAGKIVITGSHGGLIGGDARKAINVAAQLAVFNDAGVGIDRAGIGRLVPLDTRGIGAVTVSHLSARIGDGLSTYHDGVISHVNGQAAARGARVGMRLQAFVALAAGA